MISSYPTLNKLYFSLLVLGIVLLALSAVFYFINSSPSLYILLLLAGVILGLLGIICKILVWYNVYSEVVTKEEFKRVTASGTVFHKRK